MDLQATNITLSLSSGVPRGYPGLISWLKGKYKIDTPRKKNQFITRQPQKLNKYEASDGQEHMSAVSKLC